MQHSTARIYSLDALRAVMMLLGIVLHSAEPYSVGSGGLWPKDPYATSSFFNYLTSLIHLFRMPVFFMMSGFFGAMLFYRRGMIKMIRQRIKRIVLPFVASMILLHPLIYYAYDSMAKSFGWDHSVIGAFTWLPSITYRLWFLYYLIWITSITVVLAATLQKSKRLKQKIGNSFLWFFRKQWLYMLTTSILLFLLLVWMWEYWASTPLGFEPDAKIMVFYLLFYLIGWLIYARQETLRILKKNGVIYALVGFLAYTLKFIFRSSLGDVAYGGLNTIIGCLLIFGITGLFLKHFETHSKRWRYASEASYWVYLIHLPITLLIPTFIVEWPVPSGMKFSTTLVMTTFCSFITYHYLVRWTFIGAFLNGRKYTLISKD